MKTLDLDILFNTPEDIIIKDINYIFNNLINEIYNYLNLAPITSNIIISIIKELKEYSKNFFTLGVRRTIIDNRLQIEISETYLKFLKFILLREAYLCFVPYPLREKEIIQIVINEMIESALFKLGGMSEWKALVRSNIINYDFLSSQFDKLDKFFKLEATETTQSPTQFFFEFIHRNISLINDKVDNFYDILFEEFIYKSSKSLYNDELVETIRVLVKVFYNVKIFKNYGEYEEKFQDFKDKGIISTPLSKRKFSENLRWINKCTIISPSYRVDWHKANIAVLISILKFNPSLNRSDIYKCLDVIPFLHFPIFTKNGFSEEIFCYFIIPKIYIKDLLNFIEKLNTFGYISNKECYINEEQNNILNMNYFREKFKTNRRIINPAHKDYNHKFELNSYILREEPQKKIDLSLLDWIILERIGHTSLTGFAFERRAETLQSLKDELLNHIKSETNLIKNLKTSLNVFKKSINLKEKFIVFLERNKKFGFLFMYNILQETLKLLSLIEKFLSQNPHIKNLKMLTELLGKGIISQSFEDNVLIKDKDKLEIIFRDFIPLYFQSIQEYNILKEEYLHFHNFFQSCNKLKIFNINSMIEILHNEELVEKIYLTKEKKLEQSFEKFKPYKITNQELDSRIEKFIKLKLISPLLTNGIVTSSFAKYHPTILLKNTPNVRNELEKILKFFPRVMLYKMKNLYENTTIIVLLAYFIKIKEKKLFCSIIYNIFKENIISFKTYFTSGIVPFTVIKDFYDFDRNKFFYTNDLFKQSFIFIKKIFGEKRNKVHKIDNKFENKIWLKEKNFNRLIEKVEDRVSREQINFNIKNISGLINFHENLESILSSPETFRSIKEARFYTTFIKSIKFIPNFQAFGLGQFFLYIHPINVNEIDFKHLLTNSFQKIQYPVSIDKTHSFLIKYIFPYRNPNMKHLNWYVKTKRIIREYCLFTIKEIIPILNFNYNLGVKGWNYDKNRFKIYLQNVLFNPNYNIDFTNIKHFKMEKKKVQDFFGPNSIYYQGLSKIYTYKSKDIKSFLGTRKSSIIENFIKLLEKNLIFPYVELRNLDFQDKLHIILPNVKEKLNSTIINVFSFFNYGFIYKIEGEYYIYDLKEEIKFENGLMIKLYLPQCEIEEFLQLFDLFFQYLGIKNYLVLTDMTKGKSFLKAIYKELTFLESYNPLINLKWNDKDKIWVNHKIYNEKFEKIYLDLFYGSNAI